MATGDTTFMYNIPPWHPLSHQSSIPNCHQFQRHGKKYRKRRKKACYCYTSDLGNKSACNAIIGMSLFLILIVVISIAVLAIYIGMEVILDGSLRVTYGDNYTAELYNKTSHLFVTKAHTYKLMIEKVFAKSILGPAIKQCIIMGFKNGSIIVFYRLILDRRKIPSRIFANLEETAKKILFDEITTLKPSAFNTIRLDPKQIVVRKHISNPDTQTESVLESAEEASISNMNPNGVLKRVTHTTPSLVRKRPAAPIISPVTSTLPTRSKNMKKHRPPTIEKTSRIKLQLDKTTTKPDTTTTSKSSRKNIDINVSANRFSFVSDDRQKPLNNFSVSGNSSSVLIGEAEVITIPSTAVGDYSAVVEEVTSQRSKVKHVDTATATAGSVSINIVDEILSRNNGKVSSTSTSESNERKIIRHEIDGDASINDDDDESQNLKPIIGDDNAANFSLNVPTRSNIALNKPRPKPVLVAKTDNQTVTTNTTKDSSSSEIKSHRTSTTVAAAATAAPASPEIDQTTEDSVIVLNTEVVTSTSMQVSYGNNVLVEDTMPEQTQSKFDPLEDTGDNITHNVPSPIELNGAMKTTQQKYKTIFPRSIREEDDQSDPGKSPKISTHLSLIIEKYKKQPSNETLHLIIEQFAAMYTKTTTATPAALTTKLNLLVKTNYNNGMMLNKPLLHKIHHNTTTSSTTTTPAPTLEPACSNSTKQCKNGQCISEHLWCNQFADCNDGSDEKNCTCADYLRAQFAYKKICDGIVDCWDFSDENLCEWCSPQMYVCENAKLCIEQKMLCDGNRDCPLGDDEKNCITITPFSQKNNDITYQSNGIITVRRGGVWGKLCYKKEANDSVFDTTSRLAELGKAVCKTMTFRNFIGIKIINDQEDSNVNDSSIYYHLVNIQKNSTNSFRRKNFKFTKIDCHNKQVVEVICDDLECGIQTQIGKSRVHGKYRGERRSRIVGGGSAALGAWPWQAALYKEGEFQCGATLISNKWLLSAGHCFNNALHDYWVARLGILRRSSTLPSPHEQIRPIRRIIVHPNYADAGFVNDISLLEMNSEVQFTNFVRPICLPNPNRILLDGTLCTVIGWGQLMETGSVYPDTLQEVQLPVISPGECHKRTLFSPLYKITDGMLCAGFDRGGRDACLGDSGGPLMCQDNGNAWHLYGITSNGNGCARAHRPGVYTKVVNYVNWIDNSVENTTRAIMPKIQATCNGHRCPLGECLPKARVCNGYMECSNGSDEMNC
ncbi:serine protease nudel-like [Planococcus citri]|uniref:serine protease nudel-like n=1 Tax=Planococcus citri TaxID=170843 RepID=UPI0031F9E724